MKFLPFLAVFPLLSWAQSSLTEAINGLPNCAVRASFERFLRSLLTVFYFIDSMPPSRGCVLAMRIDKPDLHLYECAVAE